MPRISLCVIASLAISAAASPASAQAFTRMINFGDSLTDVGNTSSQTFGLSPGSNYYNGRYSNGPVWAEGVASSLNLAAPVASQKGGFDYATGGTHTGSGYITPISFIKLPNAGTQIESFLSNHTIASDDLITIWTGANDFLDAPTTDPSVPAANVKAHIQRLVGAGAKNILVVNLPPLGETPEYVGTSNRAMMDAISTSFNADLSANLDSVAAASPGVTLYRGDMAALFGTVLANPAAYGFTNITQPALQSNGTVVANADQYLFWDTIHPTRVGHAAISTAMFGLVTTRTLATSSGSSDWNTATSWAQRRVPDSTSAVSLASSGATTLTLTTNASVRTVMIAEAATLELNGGTLNVASDFHLTGGRVRLDVHGAGPAPIVVAGAAQLAGSIALHFVNGYIGLPGTSLNALTYASGTGTPTIVNETGYAGLVITPTVGTTALTLNLSATGGDANLDAAVNFNDLVILAQHYNAVGGQTWLTGDFTSDGNVDFNDLVDLAQHYGTQSPAGFEADWALARSIAPEPVSILGLTLLLPFARRRR